MKLEFLSSAAVFTILFEPVDGITGQSTDAPPNCHNTQQVRRQARMGGIRLFKGGFAMHLQVFLNFLHQPPGFPHALGGIC